MRDAGDLRGLPVAGLGLGVREAGPGPLPEQGRDGLGVVGDQPAFRQHRRLVAEHVPAGLHLPRVREVGAAQAARVRHRDGDESAYLPRVHHRQRPGDQAAEALADHGGVPVAQRADHAGGVLGEGARVVAARRLVAGAEAAQVHRRDPVAAGGQGAAAGAARTTRTAGSRAAAGPAGPRRRPRRGSGRRSPRPCGAPTARGPGPPRRPAAGQLSVGCAPGLPTGSLMALTGWWRSPTTAGS